MDGTSRRLCLENIKELEIIKGTYGFHPPKTESKLEEIINDRTHCCKLGKAIYGLVQAARQWWKKFKMGS